MGTRASFWVGDPRDLQNREWLGCIAWDGYPSGVKELRGVKTEGDFRAIINKYSERDDFATPDGGWPFPWDDDIFVTDCNYAFIDGAVYVDKNRNWVALDEYFIAHDADDEAKFDEWDKMPEDPTFDNVPAPKPYDRTQPDSIILITA